MQIPPLEVSEAYFSSSSQQSSSPHVGMQQEASNAQQTITKNEDEAFGASGQAYVPYDPIDDPDFTLPRDASGGENIQKILSRVRRVVDSLGGSLLANDSDVNFKRPTVTFKRHSAAEQVPGSPYSGQPVMLPRHSFWYHALPWA